MGLFGGGGGEQESSSTTSGWKPAMRDVKDDLLPRVSDFNANYGSGEGLYEGSRLADQNEWVTSGQRRLGNAAVQYGEDIDNLSGSIQGFIDYDPNSPQNVARRDAMSANVNNAFNQTIQPGIQDQFTMSGQYGGYQQQNALGAATEPLSRALADSEVQMMEGDRDRALQAAGMAPGIYSQSFVPGQVIGGIGQERTNRAQADLQDYIQQSEAGRNNKYRSISEVGGLLTPLVGLEQNTQGVQEGGSGNPLQSIMGIASMGLGAYGALSS